MTETDMTRDQLAQAPFRERIEAMTPLRRVGAPRGDRGGRGGLAHVACGTLFIAGAVLPVSGGR